MTKHEGRALFVGVSTWDVVAELPQPLSPDGRVVADDIASGGGGPASTAAATFAHLGLSARLATSVGDDRLGTDIRGSLSDEGVDITLVRTVGGVGSGSCVVLVDRSRDSRAICVRHGPPPVLSAADLEGAPLVHVDHQGLPVVEELLDGLSAPARPVVSYDAGNIHPQPCPPCVDLYVPTLAALRECYGDGDTDALLDAALADGASWVVATDGARGAVAADATGHYRVDAHDDVEIRSTLGAGDVFHGALLAGYANRMSLPSALAYANAAAGLSCAGLGGRSALPDHEQVLTRAEHRRATRTDPVVS